MFVRRRVYRRNTLFFLFNSCSILASPLSTLNSAIEESHVLSEISDLFPPTSNRKTPLEVITSIAGPDDFLPPEEKLRGVLLHKPLRGTSSIHRALTDVGVQINADLLSKVVNRGNLSAHSMLTFFRWALHIGGGVGNNVSAYNVVIKALGRRKFFAHMMELFDEMPHKGIIPNSQTLSIVLDSYVRARQVSKAIQLFWDLDKYGFRCDEETLSLVLRCLCSRSRVATACALFRKMRGRLQFDISMYNIIIGGWSKLGRVTEVDKYLKAMVDDGLEQNSVTYSYVIEGLGRAGRLGDAVKIFNYLEEEKKGCALNTVVYNAMIFNCIATADVDEALKYYEGMLSNCFDPNIDTYIRIMQYFLKTRRVADAIEMFDEMLRRGLIPTTGTVTEFLEPLCRYGPPHAALMIYKKARNAGCGISLTAYKLLLRRLSRFGKCGMLLNIWDEMQASGYSSDMQVYEYIVNGLCNTGQLETAVQVMEESIRKGFFPGKIICSKLHNKLMDSNKIEMSYRLFLKLRSVRLNENAQRYWRAKGWHF